jgi:hypothetical protein
MVTLRRAGQFDPAQFFRLDLTQVKSIHEDLSKGDQY